MKIGVFNFPTAYSMRVDEIAVEAEQRGFESLWVTEHTHIPVSRQTPWPGGADLPKEYWHTFDPFVGLSYAAAKTDRIKLATGICLLIERDTIITAKAVASLDELSQGRVIFGVGGGWNREEMENHGTVYASRFKQLEEQLTALKMIWTDDEPEFHGEFVDFDPIWSYPKPAQKPHPPIVIGGGSRHTRRRVIEHADGWMPIEISPDALLKGIEDFWQQAETALRDRSTLEISIFGARPDASTLARYEAAGVERVIFALPSKGREVLLPKLDQWMRFVDG